MSSSRINADPAELAKFSELAHRWWDPESEFRPLHQINPLRLGWIHEFVPLNGLKVLDVGCGGGILSDAMARTGAQVTGIDLADKPLMAHAKIGRRPDEWTLKPSGAQVWHRARPPFSRRHWLAWRGVYNPKSLRRERRLACQLQQEQRPGEGIVRGGMKPPAGRRAKPRRLGLKDGPQPIGRDDLLQPREHAQHAFAHSFA